MTSKTLKFPPDTEEMRVTREVHEEEDFSTRIINSTTDGILAYDRNLTYTIWNPAMERITGMKAADVIGHNALVIFPSLMQLDRAMLYTRVLGGVSVTDETVIHIEQTGITVHAQRFHSPLRDDQGSIVGGLAIVRDVSEQKKLIGQLKLLNENLELNVKQRTMELEAAVKNLAQEVKERQKAAEALRFLADSGLIFCSCLDCDTLIDKTLALLTQHFSSLCVFRILQEDGSHDRRFAHVDPEQEKLFRIYRTKYPTPVEVSPSPFITLETGKSQWTPYLTDNVMREFCQDEERFKELKKLNFKSYLIVPISSQDKILGVISVLSSTKYLDSDDLKLLEDIAGRFAMAFINVRTISSLKGDIKK